MHFASLLSQYKSAPRGQKRGREGENGDSHCAKMGRRDDRSRDRVVYLIHTPKTAGSAIKHALAQTESAGRQKFGETFRVHACDGGTVRIVSNGHTEAYKFPRQGFKVACVRHPFERFASAFSFVREGGRNHPLQGAVGQAREWKGFLQRFPSLSAFLRDAEAVRTITDPRRGHTHFLPLSHWVCDADGNLAVDFIIRQEALDADLGRLCDMLGIELKLSSSGAGGSGRHGSASAAGAGCHASATTEPVVVAKLPKFNCTGERHAVLDEDRPFLRHLLADDLKLFEGLMAQRPSLEAQAARKALKLFGTTHTFTHLRADQNVGSSAVALGGVRRKVFCIGGHKNGTLSLSCYFERLGYRTVHGCFWVNDDRLLETHDFFSDNFAEFESSRGRIAELARRFPDALFILNYRPSPAYVRSVYSHVVLNKFRVPRRRWNIDRCGRRDILRRIISTHETHEHALHIFGLDSDASPLSSRVESKRLLVINVCNGENVRNKALLDNFLGLVGDDARPDVQLERVPNYEKTESIARQMARFMESDDTVDWVERELRKVVSPERYVSKLDKLYAQACADVVSVDSK